MKESIRRFYYQNSHKFTANEIKVAGLLLTTKGQKYTNEAVAFYAGVHELQVYLLAESLRDKGVDICTDHIDGEMVHYAPHNKWWHFAIGGAMVAAIVVMILNGIFTT